jgi:L-alanine-DL-glutamate epimerase-like enolase superfamily enzyme
VQITGSELFAVPPWWLLLRPETSDGVVGRGEPIVQGTGRDRPGGRLGTLEGDLGGEDSLRIEDLDLHDPERGIGLEYLAEPSTVEFENGHVSRPTGPGLEVEVDEAYVHDRAGADVNWHNPVWHYGDGSVAEW